jgi:hypothetical protein
MNSIAFVSSFYRIFEDKEYGDAILERFKILAKYIPIYLLCSEKDKEYVESIENVIPIFKEFEDFTMYKLLSSCIKLPEQRNIKKDTKEYMILMNMKSECINDVKQYIRKNNHLGLERNIQYFVWLDAGISKIFKNPDLTLSSFYDKIKTVDLPNNKIIIPGCWGPQNNLLILERGINWRFCGGFLIIPSNLVEHFFLHNLQACGEIKGYTGKVLWEVNVWAYMEPRVPIEWRPGDHNESILTIY